MAGFLGSNSCTDDVGHHKHIASCQYGMIGKLSFESGDYDWRWTSGRPVGHLTSGASAEPIPWRFLERYSRRRALTSCRITRGQMNRDM